uniref:Uncharacterized protein n=1 Tax=Panagrellus redivivus TaxID=6233 RepID=A0A7E4VVS5_PANRE
MVEASYYFVSPRGPPMALPTTRASFRGLPAVVRSIHEKAYPSSCCKKLQTTIKVTACQSYVQRATCPSLTMVWFPLLVMAPRDPKGKKGPSAVKWGARDCYGHCEVVSGLSCSFEFVVSYYLISLPAIVFFNNFFCVFKKSGYVSCNI